MSTLKFLDEEWSWNNMTLWQFLEEGNIPIGWEDFFISESKELKEVSDDITEESGKSVVYPPIHQVFRAFLPLKDIKVVILGQDPYHNGSAIGYCFSVLPGNRINPSLRNMYNELKQEGYRPNENGNIIHWAEQGCLLLNTALTVEKASADSHTNLWRDFTEKVMQHVSEQTKNVVWMLFGSKALAFRRFIDEEKHNVLITSHPSPFSAHKGFREHPSFLGSNVFKDANNFLIAKKRKAIKW